MGKKTIIITCIIVVTCVLIGLGVKKFIVDNNSDGSPGKEKKEEVKITASEAKKVEFEQYDNGLVSLQIPKGWKVEVAPFDYIHYAFTVYNPQNTDYRMFFMMKSEGYLKTQKMKDWYNKNYHSIMSELPVVDPQTTEQFFKILTEAFKVSETGGFNYPKISNFKKIESLGKNEIGGEIIRGTYTKQQGG